MRLLHRNLLTKRNYLSFWHQPRPLINKAAPMGARRDCSHSSPQWCEKVRRWEDCSCLCALDDRVVVCISCLESRSCHVFFSLFVFVGLENITRGPTAEHWLLKASQRSPVIPFGTKMSEEHFSAVLHSPLLSRPNRHVGHLFISHLFTLFVRLVFPTFWNGNSQRRSWLCTTVHTDAKTQKRAP